MKHLDLTYLIENVTDDKEFIVMLLGVFKKNLEPDIDALRQSVSHSNHEQIKRDAHKVKSSFRSLGMNEMTRVLQEIEDAGKNIESISSIQAKLTFFESEVPQVLNEVNDYLASN